MQAHSAACPTTEKHRLGYTDLKRGSIHCWKLNCPRPVDRKQKAYYDYLYHDVYNSIWCCNRDSDAHILVGFLGFLLVEDPPPPKYIVANSCLSRCSLFWIRFFLLTPSNSSRWEFMSKALSQMFKLWDEGIVTDPIQVGLDESSSRT